jgi:hypothetical protein
MRLINELAYARWGRHEVRYDLSEQDSSVGVHELPHSFADLELCLSLFRRYPIVLHQKSLHARNIVDAMNTQSISNDAYQPDEGQTKTHNNI